MKLSVKPNQLKYLILGAGGLGLILRAVLYATGVDEKGLLVSGHWAHFALWVLTALVFAALWLFTKEIQGPEAYRDCFPASTVRGIGAFAAAVMILITTLSGLSAIADRLDIIVTVLGAASALCLAYVGYCRLCGIKPGFLAHVVLCLFFALRMVCQYRAWSSDPQLMDYCFYLGAYVALMLTAYHHAAFDAGMGKHRVLWVLSLASVYLCAVSVSGGQDLPFLLGTLAWSLTALPSLTAKPRRKRPSLVMDREPSED